MAVPNPGGNVYKRDTPEDLHEAWNAVIRKVNDERENPPEDTDCEALDPIDEVEEDHIWTKQDVEEVRDAIDEMCEFSWTEDLEYWKDEIITEIEEALDREWGGWGDEDECCEEECIPACEDCGEEVNTIEVVAAEGCLVEQWPDCIDHIQWGDVRDAARDYYTIMGPLYSAISLFNWYHPQYCRLVKEVEDLEEELEELEDELAVLEEARDEECAKPPPNNCAAAQEAVDAKQDEVDEKQEELDEKKAERDEAQENMNTASEAADYYALAQIAIINAASSPHARNMYASLVSPSHHPWVGQDCETKHGYRGVSRCRWGWSLGFQTEDSDPDYWNTRCSGWYTPNGVPYATSLSVSSPFASYYCVWCCWGLGGGGSPDWCYNPLSLCGSAGSCPTTWRLHAHADLTSCYAYDPSTGDPC